MYSIIDRAFAGEISALAVTYIHDEGVLSRQLITTVRDSDRNLKVIFWTLNNQEITRGISLPAGEISTSLDVCSIRGGIAIGLINSEDNLQIKVYGFHQFSVENAYANFNESNFYGGRASRVALESLFYGRILVAAVRNSAHNLEISTYRVIEEGAGHNVNISKQNEAIAGEIWDLSITLLGENRIITAVRDSDSQLRVIVWEIGQNGSITRRGHETAGYIYNVAVSAIGRDRFFTAVRDSEGNLKIILWEVNNSGQPIRRGDYIAGQVSNIAASANYTAVRDAQNNLLMIEWRFADDGTVSRGASGTLSDVSLIAMTGLITAVRDGDNNLRIIWWANS